ncbi:MAG: helix-turn-helix domain-containing protein [Clostridia bacterium]|jgi:repressor LexA|nr:helix-turn-helix domain-containing protein [Clostridia bacterium]
MNIELWKKRKKELNLTIDEIAKKANLPKGSVQNIFAGYVPDPRASTVEAIEKALGLNKPNANKGVWIPVYGNIAAGIPIEAIEDIIDQEEIPTEMTNNGEYIALRVKGSSMEPRIKEGDVVIIKRQETIENGEIAAVLVNGNDVTLKQVKVEDSGIWLIPFNSAFPHKFYTKKECADLPVRILGKMVELRAKF